MRVRQTRCEMNQRTLATAVGVAVGISTVALGASNIFVAGLVGGICGLLMDVLLASPPRDAALGPHQ